jgi:glycosyltransferase involved in cell wall biosynthesis
MDVMKRVKLAIVCSHPIQYYAPVFRRHAHSESVLPRVFYTWSQTADGPVYDPDFGARFAWDIPLLEGYDYRFVKNTAKEPSPTRFFGVRTPHLAYEVVDWGADAILVYGWNTLSHLSTLMRFKGRIPVLFRGDSTLIDHMSPPRLVARKLYLRWVYSHVDVAIAVGQNNRDYFMWCGIPSERIAFAPHSVDTVRFADPDGTRTRRALEWRTQLGVPEQSLVLVFAGKFTAKKDPLLLLEAFAALDRPAHLVFVGSGELENPLRQQARGRSNVHFLPFQNQSDMPSIYRLGDIFVLPSRGPGETWGLAMNEAMASGCPVIAGSRVGGARDLIIPGETGWMFESGNLHALIGVLKSALSTGRDALARMGQAARRSSDRWSTEAAARGIEDAAVRAVLRTRHGADSALSV